MDLIVIIEMSMIQSTNMRLLYSFDDSYNTKNKNNNWQGEVEDEELGVGNYELLIRIFK